MTEGQTTGSQVTEGRVTRGQMTGGQVTRGRVTGGQEALAFSFSVFSAAGFAATGAGFAAS